MSLFKPTNKNRNASYRRHKRKVHIQRKKKILKEIYHYKGCDFSKKQIGFLDKGKVHCSCKICKYEKHFNISKKKYQLSKNDKELIGHFVR